MKQYSIKVPVYLTEAHVVENDQMFSGSFPEMIETIKSALDNFTPITVSTRNKSKKVVIDNVEYFDYDVENHPVLLLQISAYNTNINDGYCEIDQKVLLGSTGKIGSDTNYVLMYPKIDGIHPDSKSCYFLMLVFEDPTKDSGDVQRLAKILAKNCLHQPVRNVKPDVLLQEIRSLGTIPQLEIHFSGISFDDDCDHELRQYLLSSSVKRQKEEKYTNVPTDKLDYIYNLDSQEESGYKRRVLSCIFGKKQFKFTKDLRSTLEDAEQFTEEFAEKVFNMTTNVSEEEMRSGCLADKNFVLNKLLEVLSNYLNSYVD